MSRKRYLAVAGMLVILALVGFGVAMMLPLGPGVTKANFDRIEDGMTRADVEAIFGRPSDHTQYFPRYPDFGIADVWSIAGDNFGHARIYFVDDHVKGQYSTWIQAEPESLIQKLRGWLNL